MNKVNNEKLYTITTDNGTSFTNNSVKMCFAEFLNYNNTSMNVTDRLQNLLYCLQDLSDNCSQYVIKKRINKVCYIIEFLNPMLEKEIIENGSARNTMTLYVIMKDYILELTNRLTNTMVIDMLNKFVMLDTVDFEVKNNEI